MRWKYPQDGDERTRDKFCWWPIGHNGIFYWLETVKLYERYSGYCQMWFVTDIEEV